MYVFYVDIWDKIEEMKCLNTRGCNNEAKYIEELKCSNFCSYECYLIYSGKKKPSIPEKRRYEDPERQKLHDLYIWATCGEVPDWAEENMLILPPPKNWIVTLESGETFLWDDFEKKYVRYVLGKGIVDEFGRVIADENSEYYRAVVDRINDVQFDPDTALTRKVPKPKKKRGVKEGAKRGKYKQRKEEVTLVCKGCGRTFTAESKRKQFHSDACRRRYWRKMKARKEALERQSVSY